MGSGKRYAEAVKDDALMHRAVVKAVNGLTGFLKVERKRTPALVVRDSERLESMLFSGYYCYFEGVEPPGL